MTIDFDAALGRTFDVCIVGAGPAGIICALELARIRPDTTILLIEYGGQPASRRNSLDDSIEITNPINHHDPYECTNKGLGGSSATWGGRCVMYDPVDFIPREPFAEHCTWPPGIADSLSPFIPRASDYFECGPGGFDLHRIEGVPYRPIADGFREGEVTDSMLERWSMPTRFGARYRAALEGAKGIFVLVGGEARSIRDVGPDGSVGSILIRETGSRREGSIRANAYVLAAGAQESTRVLLRSPETFRALDHPPAALGKYYQGHVSGKIASVKFNGDPQKTVYGFLRTPTGEYLRRRFQFSTDTLIRRRILNTAFGLDNPLYVDPGHRSGAMSFMYLAMITPILGRKLAPPAIAHSITKGKVERIGAHLLNVLRGLPGSLWIPGSIFIRRYLPARKLPGVFLYNPENRYALHFHAEQIPIEKNRMELAADGETLTIHYGYADHDIQSVIDAHGAFDEWLRACGCGQLEYWHPPERRREAILRSSKDGLHQVGTTRIAARAQDGVVDGDLRVWGTRNLFVCSSSVFPTSGQANPTFMLGAFAARLAEHLSKHALR